MRNSSVKIILDLIRNRKIIGPMFLLIGGYFLYIVSLEGNSIEYLWREKGPRFLATLLMAGGTFWLYIEFFAAWIKGRQEDKFSDVDARWRNRSDDDETKRILKEIKDIKAGQQTIDYEKLASLVESSTTKRREHRENQFESFGAYFDALSSLLEEQSKIADEKASILLDKGTSYSRNGIVFFFGTIVAWQILAALYGFRTQHMYGIASCSLLFVFIEFLSAWFLKQYRHYVDTSTYLLKVKSIFDRFMLSYLTISKASTEEESKRFASLLALLSEDIKWPESYLLKSADISFAKEALDTLAVFARAMKSEAKEKNESHKSKSDA